MPARDSSGRQVSLLNEEPARQVSPGKEYFSRPVVGASDMMRSTSKDSLPSSASPGTPGLIRSDSYDSHNTAAEPQSPITPNSIDDYGRTSSFLGHSESFKDPILLHQYDQRTPSFEYSSQSQYPMAPGQIYGDARTSSYSQSHLYDDDSYPDRGALSPHITERGQKRYPCRFANEFSCDKTFTTSGHASRHSKIHTAEKAVPCSYDGCPKKFTRADNMKQHLETHFKERSRASIGARPAVRPGPQVLTKPARIRKISHQSSRNNSVAELPPVSMVDPALVYSGVQRGAAASPVSGPLNMDSSFKEALESRPVPARSGLDTLAAAADYQAQNHQ